MPFWNGCGDPCLCQEGLGSFLLLGWAQGSLSLPEAANVPPTAVLSKGSPSSARRGSDPVPLEQARHPLPEPGRNVVSFPLKTGAGSPPFTRRVWDPIRRRNGRGVSSFCHGGFGAQSLVGAGAWSLLFARSYLGSRPPGAGPESSPSARRHLGSGPSWSNHQVLSLHQNGSVVPSPAEEGLGPLLPPGGIWDLVPCWSVCRVPSPSQEGPGSRPPLQRALGPLLTPEGSLSSVHHQRGRRAPSLSPEDPGSLLPLVCILGPLPLPGGT